MNSNESHGEENPPEPIDPKATKLLVDALQKVLDENNVGSMSGINALVSVYIANILVSRNLQTQDLTLVEIEPSKIPEELRDLFALYVKAVAELKTYNRVLMERLRADESGLDPSDQ